MARTSGGISSMAVVLGLILAWSLFHGPIMKGLYAAGLIHHPTLEEVQKELARTSPYEVYTCQPGTDGWEYFCDSEYRGPQGYQGRYRYAILSSYISMIQWKVQLADGKPVPSVAEYFKGKPRPY